MTAEHYNHQQIALAAFLQDLPKLWAQRPGQWVAYQSDQCLGFARLKHELYQDCYKRGFQREQFVIFCIEPQETEMTVGPLLLD